MNDEPNNLVMMVQQAQGTNDATVETLTKAARIEPHEDLVKGLTLLGALNYARQAKDLLAEWVRRHGKG